MERAKVERAKFVVNHASAFARDDHRWVAAGGDKRAAGSDKRSHTEDSICSEEDDTSTLWEEEEFEAEVRMTVASRSSIDPCTTRLAKGTGGDSRRR